MKNKKEFYEGIEEVIQTLLEIDPIKNRAENVFLLFKGSKIMFAVGGDDKEGQLRKDLGPYTHVVTDIISKMAPLYENSYEVGDEEINIKFVDYINKKPEITEEEVKEFLENYGLNVLTTRLNDKEFCLEVLNIKFSEERTDEVNNIFKYFNS